METKLTRIEGWNPFILFGKEIRSIVFYGNGKEIARTKWFGSNNDYKSVTLPFEVKKALRVNLDRKDAYYVKAQSDYPLGPSYDLYIPSELVGLKFVEVKKDEYWNFTQTRDVYSVNLHGVRGKYKKNEKGDFVYEFAEGDYVEQFDCNYSNTDTEEKRRCDELAEALNKLCHGRLTYYDIHDILKEYDITPKKH